MVVNIDPVRPSCVLRNTSTSTITILGRYSLRAGKTADLFKVIEPLREEDVINAFSIPSGELYQLVYVKRKLSLLKFEAVTQRVGRMDNLLDTSASSPANADILQYNFSNRTWEAVDHLNSRHWSFETLITGVEYAGGFYIFGGTANDFSPSINFGTANASYAAHFLVVTGATTVDEVQITVSGRSIADDGVSTPADSEIITIPSGTPANSYFETPKKWLGQISVETTSGTAISCNYGYCKYHDVNNKDFQVIGLETLWTSNTSGNSSDIELLHHKATGWTYNAGAEPDPPTPIASRSVDHGASDEHIAGGSGAWKRANLSTNINGADSEGILWRITSATSGTGNQSFRQLNLELSLKMLPPGTL